MLLSSKSLYFFRTKDVCLGTKQGELSALVGADSGMRIARWNSQIVPLALPPRRKVFCPPSALGFPLSASGWSLFVKQIMETKHSIFCIIGNLTEMNHYHWYQKHLEGISGYLFCLLPLSIHNLASNVAAPNENCHCCFWFKRDWKLASKQNSCFPSVRTSIAKCFYFLPGFQNCGNWEHRSTEIYTRLWLKRKRNTDFCASEEVLVFSVTFIWTWSGHPTWVTA